MINPLGQCWACGRDVPDEDNYIDGVLSIYSNGASLKTGVPEIPRRHYCSRECLISAVRGFGLSLEHAIQDYDNVAHMKKVVYFHARCYKCGTVENYESDELFSSGNNTIGTIKCSNCEEEIDWVLYE